MRRFADRIGRRQLDRWRRPNGVCGQHRCRCTVFCDEGPRRDDWSHADSRALRQCRLKRLSFRPRCTRLPGDSSSVGILARHRAAAWCPEQSKAMVRRKTTSAVSMGDLRADRIFAATDFADGLVLANDTCPAGERHPPPITPMPRLHATTRQGRGQRAAVSVFLRRDTGRKRHARIHQVHLGGGRALAPDGCLLGCPL